MHPDAVRKLLEDVAAGRTRPDDAMEQLRHMPFEAINDATIDHHRALRCGFPEVIFGQGKTDEQVLAIFSRLAAAGADVLATRVAPSAAAAVLAAHPHATHHELARALTLRHSPPSPTVGGYVGVIAAGTSDLPVAEEARVTLEIMGVHTQTLYDVGVAGLHRLLARSQFLRDADVLVVAAGMEGALPSVVGGLVEAPVIAVPTSIGYGASFGGIAALLSMLNSCAPGISVVNIDNGFGAAYQAAMIWRRMRNGQTETTQNASTEPAVAEHATNASGAGHE